MESFEPGPDEIVADQFRLDGALAGGTVALGRFETVVPVEPIPEGVGGGGVGRPGDRSGERVGRVGGTGGVDDDR